MVIQIPFSSLDILLPSETAKLQRAAVQKALPDLIKVINTIKPEGLHG